MVSTLSELNLGADFPKIKRKIVSIGTGGIVRGCHYPAYNLAGFEVVGAYDIKEGVAQTIAADFQVANVCQTLQQAIEIGYKEQAVFDIAVPASSIAAILRELPPGSAVLMQKPMGEDIAQATDILNICKEKNMVAGVNFQMRHAPYIVAAKQMVDRDELGEIYDIEIQECVYTPWHLWDFLYKVKRMEILYHSIHFVDVVRYFIGTPDSVYCKTMKHPEMMGLAQTKSTIILNYGDTLRAGLQCNHGHKYGPAEQQCYLKIEGEKGAIKIVIGVYLDYPTGKPDKFSYTLLNDNIGWRDLEIKGSWYPEAFVGPMAGLMKKMEDPSYEYVNDVEDAYQTMMVLEALYQSSASGGTKVAGRPA